ncbi:Alpha/Beta hydrolase protein [Hyaloraphidium curvatum]|nr:Alpha/Beta hydrolase protein [Hyaloraphidium curvatum]
MLASRLGLVQAKQVPFTVTSKDGTKLSALLELKQKDSNQCVIIVHGGLDNKRAPIIRALANGMPYNCVTFDFRGMGESEGVTRQSGYEQEAEDLEAVVKAVKEQHKLTPVAVVCHSRGGTSSTFYYSRNPGPNTPQHLVYINPSFAMLPTRKDAVEAYEKVKKTGQPEVQSKYRNRGKLVDYVLTPEDIAYREKLDFESILKKVAPEVKTLVVQGSKDEILGTTDGEAYDRTLKGRKSHRYVVLDGHGHYYRDPEEQQQLVQEIRRWLVDVSAFGADKPGGEANKLGGKVKIRL